MFKAHSLEVQFRVFVSEFIKISRKLPCSKCSFSRNYAKCFSNIMKLNPHNSLRCYLCFQDEKTEAQGG